MYGWVNGKINGVMNEWVIRLMNEWGNEWMNEFKFEWIKKRFTIGKGCDWPCGSIENDDKNASL